MAGLPGIDDLATYGGAKQNYAPVEDPTTDVDAAHLNLIASNVAGMTQTAMRAWCAFVGHATAPEDPASHVHGAVWGSGPDLKPEVERDAEGVYVVTWPEEVTDELGVEHTVNLRRALVSVEGSTPYLATATVTAPNQVTVRVFDVNGDPDDGVGSTFFVTAV